MAVIEGITTTGNIQPVQVDADGIVQTSGSGGGGGGGAITVADAADINAGATTDAAWTTGSGTINSLLKAIAASAISTAAAAVKGFTASGSAIASAPVTTGGRATTALPTAVADGQVVNQMFDKYGRAVVRNALRELMGDQLTTMPNSTAETTIITAVASTFLDIYGIIISNASATITVVTIKDDTAGTTRAVFEVPANDTRGFMLPAGSGLTQAVVNKPWTATLGTATTPVTITALYTKNA